MNELLRRDVSTGVHGLLGVALNLLAVVFLRPIPHTYTPNVLGEWLSECRAAPISTTLSAWSFTIGLVALAIFAAGIARAAGPASSLVAAGAWWFFLGAFLDAAGTLAPMVALSTSDEVGRGLLQLTLSLDAAFNACLGIGLVLINVGWSQVIRGPLRWLGIVAGLVSIPVVLQFTSSMFAKLLFVASPLWLLWITWMSIRLIRAPRDA